MKKPFLQLPYLLAAMGLLSLSACKQQNAATEQAAQELNEIRDNDIAEFFAEDRFGSACGEQDMQETIRLFSKRQDVQAANAQGLTMLHLACLFQKGELMRCLLLDGADPNKHSFVMHEGQQSEGDNALEFLFYGITDESKAEDIIPLVDLLIKHGAKINPDDPNSVRPLDIVGLNSNMEKLFLHILQLTDNPITPRELDDGTLVSCLTRPTLNQWPETIKILIEMGADATLSAGNEQVSLLSIVFHSLVDWTEQGRESAQILIENGADINKCDIYGRNAMFSACKILVEQRQDDFDEISLADKLAFMLEKGADPYLRADGDIVYPGFCAFDFMIMRPNIIKKLKEKGFELKIPPLYVPEDDLAVLATLCRAAQTNVPAQEFAPYVKRLQDVLMATSPKIIEHELYPTAVEVALQFLIAIDEQAANEFISSLPSWYAKRDWTQLDAQITPILMALQDIHEYRVDSKIILYVADELDKAKQTASAIEVLQMLSRCDNRELITAELLKSERLAMRSGALYAELLAANLPLPNDGMVEAWLTQREQVADSEKLQKAVLLTSKPRLWFGDMSEEEQETMLQAMVDIGVPQAAEQYRRIIANIDNPEGLDKIMNEDTTWHLELEAAIAAFIWEIREEFFAKAIAGPQTPEAHRHIHIHSDCCGH